MNSGCLTASKRGTLLERQTHVSGQHRPLFTTSVSSGDITTDGNAGVFSPKKFSSWATLKCVPCSIQNCQQDFWKLEQRVQWILLIGFYNGSKDEKVLYDLMSQEGQLQDLCNQNSWSRPLLWSLIQLFKMKFLSFIIRIRACGLLRRLCQWVGHVS